MGDGDAFDGDADVRRGARSGGSSASDSTIAAEAVEFLPPPTTRRAGGGGRHAAAAAASAAAVHSESDTLSELEEDDDDDDHDHVPPTPRFLQDEGDWKHWMWVPYPVRRFCVTAARWSLGPPDARPFTITPLLPALQQAPPQLVAAAIERVVEAVSARSLLRTTADDRSSSSSSLLAHEARKARLRQLGRRGLYFGWLFLWLVTFALVMRHGLVAGEIAEWGVPGDIGCGTTYWVAGNGCGLDGSDCRPFNGSGFAFRCPASCASYQVLNPRAVGDQEVVYQTLVVGGPGSGSGTGSGTGSGNGNGNGNASSFYRGDSFICSAAIHAGVVSNTAGGCGVVRLVGQQSGFAASKRHGIDSIGFPSYFPLAFAFEEGVACPGAQDMRWSLLAVSVVFSTVLSLCVTDPGCFFFAVFTGLFWHVGLASDPPPHATVPALLSNLTGKFLPAAFVAWVVFDKMGVRRTLTGLAAPVEKTVLWLGACWVGALDNYTFDHIPIQRLTPHDLAQQPGAKAALALILVVLAGAVALQVRCFRREGRLRRYLRLYGLLAGGLVAGLLVPGLQLRLHHYVLALLLLPGTGMQTRPALLFQGLLVGLFVNGIARWGWDAVLQTAAALQDDAQVGSPLPVLRPPLVRLANETAVAAAVAGAQAAAQAVAAAGAAAASAVALAAVAAANTSSITFAFEPAPGPRYDGISALVNDVERFRGFFDDSGRGRGPAAAATTFVWERPADAAVDEYFRFAFLEGSRSDDYTKAGIWRADGAWVPMAPGPSRVRSRAVADEGWRDGRSRG